MLVTSLCRVDTLLVSEPILDCRVVRLVCRFATAALALRAAVAAADALEDMAESIEERLEESVLTFVLSVAIDVEMPVIVVPHAEMFLSIPVMLPNPVVDSM
jgi:hypothetical protein